MKLRVLLLAFTCLFSQGLLAQVQADEPVALVENITGHIFEEVSKNLEEYSANPQELEALVRDDLLPLLDIKYSARLILGRAGRGLAPEKIDEFATVMSDLLVSRYASGLLEFSSKVKIRVLPQRGELNEKITRVRTRVTLTDGGEAPVDYAFRKTRDGWKAFDVIIEGISYVTTYRNQIMPEVQATGIDSVIERIGSGQLEIAE
jgi:phospholipid transport system substrate-binding protein